MKIKMTALELILHLADGSTTPNTLKHIAKIAKTTLEEMKAREEMQPFEDMADPAYFRGFAHGKAEAQRTWVGLTDMEIDQGLCRTPYAMKTAEAWREGVRWAYHQLKEKNI